jgi:hypothetical protein
MVLTGRYLWVSPDLSPRKPLADLPQLLQADVREGSSMMLDDVPTLLRVLSAAPALIAAVTAVVAALLVARVIRAIASGQPFAARSIRALAGASAVLVVGGLAQGIVDTAATAALTSWITSATEAGGPFEHAVEALGVDLPHWPVMIIVVGLVTSALTVAFRQGALLQAETDGLV